MMKMNEKVLKDIYYDPTNPASFGSIKKLYDSSKRIIPIKYNEVKDWRFQAKTHTHYINNLEKITTEKKFWLPILMSNFKLI